VEGGRDTLAIVDRVIAVARLKAGARERAEELLTGGVGPFVPETAFERGAIFLSEDEVVFLFEGRDADQSLRAILNDPVRSSALAPWLLLFEGPLHAAREAHSWER